MVVRRLGTRLGRTPEEDNWWLHHLLVTIDKFSKWIEARPITSIRSEQVVLFFTDIVHRFGVSNCIITDNDTQFIGKKFLDFYDNHHICVLWSVVAHPKTNG
jgi:hypothetical protein